MGMRGGGMGVKGGGAGGRSSSGGGCNSWWHGIRRGGRGAGWCGGRTAYLGATHPTIMAITARRSITYQLLSHSILDGLGMSHGIDPPLPSVATVSRWKTVSGTVFPPSVHARSIGRGSCRGRSSCRGSSYGQSVHDIKE